MYRLDSNLGPANIVEKAEDLPSPEGAQSMFMDHETALLNGREFKGKKAGAFYPYLGDRIFGTAVAFDEGEAYYVPVRHVGSKRNIDLEVFQRWHSEVVKVPRWINHNVKFDAHFSLQEPGGLFLGEMVDTAVLAKMVDSDRLTHALKPFCRDVLGLPMAEEKEVAAFLKSAKTKDYARLPINLAGTYACEDVYATRKLYEYAYPKLQEQMPKLLETEIKLTGVLFDVERRGIAVDKVDLLKRKVTYLQKLVLLEDRISEIIGREFTDSSKTLYEVLVNTYGLPVLAYNENGNPSFDSAALKLYRLHPEVTINARLVELVEAIQEYRELSTFKSLYLDSWVDLLSEEGYLHPRYNQVVRTGRMSGSSPNFQQLNKEAKELVRPQPGRAIISCDASQVEFRVIVHYIKDEQAIEAYLQNPRTDFHSWVAELCEIKRKAAKNVNFAMAFNAGERKIRAMLQADPDIMEAVSAEIAELNIPEAQKAAEFERRCEDRARHIYATYHERLPGIQVTRYQAQEVAKLRGYIINFYGRRRHLPCRFAYRGFNSVIQGTAMDYIKGRMVALSPRYNEFMRERDIHIFGNVHDEIPFDAPAEVAQDPEVLREINRVLEFQEKPFRVPFKWDIGISLNSWAEAAGEEGESQAKKVLSGEKLF